VIFISYSWADAPLARSVANLLIEQGHQVWIDYQNLNLTKPLAPQLAQAIWTADLFLFIDSSYARSSRWVQFELFLARIWCKSIQIIYPLNEASVIGSSDDVSRLLLKSTVDILPI
jgi:hypothetical protein